MALIFDIETVGDNFDDYDEATKRSLTRWIEREAGDDLGKYQVMLKDLKQGLGFSPLTGQIITIGVYDTEKKMGVVNYSTSSVKVSIIPEQHVSISQEEQWQQGEFTFKPKTEAEMLKNFWQGAKNYREFISFNGRSFDVPFLLIRSAVHRLKPTVDLMSNRYLNYQNFSSRHIDLLDQLSFYGAVKRKGNLHLYCKAFGINSPKARGVSGDEVNYLFNQGQFKLIAEYNSWDLLATMELYKIWQEYIKI